MRILTVCLVGLLSFNHAVATAILAIWLVSAFPALAEPVSRLPVDVVLDYTYHTGHLHNGAGEPLYPLNGAYWNTFLDELRKAPPDILTVGKEAPLTHSIGPIASYGGENQTFPSIGGKDGRWRLTPEQLGQRSGCT